MRVIEFVLSSFSEPSEHKKSRTIPIREIVGPTKNLPLNDREAPSKSEDTLVPCWHISIQRQKVFEVETWSVYDFFC